MPANRSRTTRWRTCLEQIRERGGALEIAVARSRHDEEDARRHLVWRVKVIDLTEEEIVVEQPVALGQPIRLEPEVALVGAISVGQNRWSFETTNLGPAPGRSSHPRRIGAIRLRMPTSVRRCQRRVHDRVQTAALQLPNVELWPLLEPRSVILAERANELEFERHEAEGGGAPFEPETTPEETGIMPEVGPKFNGLMFNVGGGGIGLQIPPEHGQLISRHRLFWLRVTLRPELSTPISASAKLVHTHMKADQSIYAGMAFDFTFNADHQRFVVSQICRFVAEQQRVQLAA